MTLGERLKEIVDTLGISYTSLSGDMGYSKTYIQQIIRGNSKNPNRYLFSYLESVYNVNPRWLMDGVGDMFLEGGRKYDDRLANMLRKIEKLPPKEREAVGMVVEGLLLRAEMNKQADKRED